MLLSFCCWTLSAGGTPVKVPVLLEFAATVLKLATVLIIYSLYCVLCRIALLHYSRYCLLLGKKTDC